MLNNTDEIMVEFSPSEIEMIDTGVEDPLEGLAPTTDAELSALEGAGNAAR